MFDKLLIFSTLIVAAMATASMAQTPTTRPQAVPSATQEGQYFMLKNGTVVFRAPGANPVPADQLLLRPLVLHGEGRGGASVEIENDDNGKVTIHGCDAAQAGEQMRAFLDQISANTARKIKAAYLGVSVAPATTALSDQLKLDKNTGLVVNYIEADSPALKAGLKNNDVLTRLNDQILINPQQLAVLVRSFKPGDEIRLTLIRQAQPQTITARLVEKEVCEIADGEANAGWTQWAGPQVMEPPKVQVQLQGQSGAAPSLPFMPVMPGGKFAISFSTVAGAGDDTITMPESLDKQELAFDDGLALTLTRENGKGVHLLAKDKDGKVLFDGSVTTPEQRKTLPETVAAKLTALQSTLALPICEPSVDAMMRGGTFTIPNGGMTRPATPPAKP